jgi:archaetidylinositol phosphate synthase
MAANRRGTVYISEMQKQNKLFQSSPSPIAPVAMRPDSASTSSTRSIDPPPPRTWDARAARWLVTPLKSTRVTPNHLTTLRLLVGAAGALVFAQGGYGWSNLGAALIVLSNFIDHTDGELARISGKTSRFGHFYDLASDAVVTIALFAGIGFGVGAAREAAPMFAPPALLGCVAGAAIALIFFLRMRIEERAGKAGTKQATFAGFETEDVLYLIPLVTLFDSTHGFLLAAAIGAPLFAILVIADYLRVMRKMRQGHSASASNSVN